jgi:hypothetical protein
MERGYLSRRHYFLVFAAVFIFMASVAVFILCFDLRYGSSGAVMAVIAAGAAGAPFIISIATAIAIAIFVPMFARKPLQPANYPRIEHLRIAGKYAPTSAAKIGLSPLRLQ